MTLLKELEKAPITIMLVPSTKYNETVVKKAKEFSGKQVGYVTLNKTFPAIREAFEKKKIDTKDFVFIDAVSKSIMNVPDQTRGCYYVSAPNALTELSIAVNRLLRHNFEFLVFDSLSTLVVYQKQSSVVKFANSIISQARAHNAKVLFYAIDSAEQKPLVDEVSMFADKVANA